MDFANTATDTGTGDDTSTPAASSARAVIFRSRRTAGARLHDGSAVTALRTPNLTILPIDALLKRTNGKIARITLRDPEPAADRPYSLFKTVSAMRGQQGFRLRP